MVLFIVQRVHIGRALAVILVSLPVLLRDSWACMTLLNPVWTCHHPTLVVQLLVSKLGYTSVDSDEMVRRRPSPG